MAIISPHEGTIIFEFGKHAGKTFEEVERTDRKYLTWVRNSDLMAEASNDLFERFDVLMEMYKIPLSRGR
jgi:hypothetical protein